jgi:hypothetical protein
MDGQFSFLAESSADNDSDQDSSIAALPEYPQGAMLNMEKDMLGLYVSGHPLDGYTAAIAKYANCDTRAFRQAGGEEDGGGGGGGGNGNSGGGVGNGNGGGGNGMPASLIADGQNVVIGGIIARAKTKFTKNNQMMAFVDFEDMYGSIEMLVFPKVYERLEEMVKTDKIVLVKGKISSREDEDAKLLCDDIIGMSISPQGGVALTHPRPQPQPYPQPYPQPQNKASGPHDNKTAVQYDGKAAGPHNKLSGPYDNATRLYNQAAGLNDSYAPGAYDNKTIGMNNKMREPYNDYAQAAPATGGRTERPADYVAPGNDSDGNAGSLYIRINGDESKPQLNSAFAAMKFFSGHTPVILYNQKNKTMKELDKEYWVKPVETFLNEMRERFGAENVAIK